MSSTSGITPPCAGNDPTDQREGGNADKATLKPQPDDVQDIILIRPPTMLWVRMHLQWNGVAYQERWGAFLWELFTTLDTDGDLFLSYNEFKRGPWEQFTLRAAGEFTTCPKPL